MSLTEDKLGVFVSFVCLVHCGLGLAAATILPFLGRSFGHSEAHLWLALAVLVVSTWAFGRGYCAHGRLEILFGALLGVSLVVTGVLVEDFSNTISVLVTIVGSVVLIYSHRRNSVESLCTKGCCRKAA